ncbi:MAG: 2-amino-4-hydroxy-6-hydroxymethyldihydropteridine diphosphokinase [Pseudomonadota bacterium]
MTHRAWLGLGGNVGDVELGLKVSLQAIHQSDGCSVETVSLLYETPPWGLLNQPLFLNCCAEVLTDLEPEALLVLCQQIELTGKRERIQRWGPRTVDIDILIFDGVEQADKTLTLPHPRMLERAFVMLPLADIAADLEIARRTVTQHLAALDTDGIKTVRHDGEWWRANSD